MEKLTTTEKRYAVQIRAKGEDRTISGTAIVFNTESQLLGGMFTEIIKPEAVSADLLSNSNIVMLWNHSDDEIPLARCKYGKGSLSIAITPQGVDFSFVAKNTPQGDEILAAVRSGDVDACSFSFAVAAEGDDWFCKPDGTYLRTITKFSTIGDFSLVNDPAYVETVCRSLDAFKATETRDVIIPEPVIVPEPVVVPEPVIIPEPVTIPEPVVVEPTADEIAINEYYTELETVISNFSNQ